MTKLTDEAISALLVKNNNKQEIKTDEFNVTLDEVNDFGNKASLREMFVNIAAYNKMLSEKITFINNSLTKAIPFTRENLYLICAYTGSGKSTIAANISFPLWQQKKKTLIISNEESQQDVLFRIACLHLDYNFNDYKKGYMSLSKQKEVVKLFPAISQYVKVIDVNYKNGLTTKLEGIKNALEAVKGSDFSAALIDYYQLIQYSIVDSSRSRYNVLNDLRIFLGQYIKNSNIPIVVFAQLHSMGKRTNKDLDNRVKECPTILEPSTVVIEAIPDFELKTTDLLIHKDRFGMAGHRVTCAFERGKFTDITEDELQQRKLNKLSEVAEKNITEEDNQT